MNKFQQFAPVCKMSLPELYKHKYTYLRCTWRRTRGGHPFGAWQQHGGNLRCHISLRGFVFWCCKLLHEHFNRQGWAKIISSASRVDVLQIVQSPPSSGPQRIAVLWLMKLHSDVMVYHILFKFLIVDVTMKCFCGMHLTQGDIQKPD